MVEKIENGIKLRVVESLQDDAYKGITRIDIDLMRKLELERGDIVSIKGDRETYSIVDQGYPADRGEKIIRMDGITRKNAKTGIGEQVNIKKAKIKEAKKVKPFNNYVDMWAIQVMCQLYLYYHQTIKRDPRFTEQNFSHCVKYYKEVFKQYDETMTHDNFAQIFSETISEQAPNNKDVLPEKTIYQFIEELKKS